MLSTQLLAIDQGTTSTRAIVFDERGAALRVAQRELKQSYPAEGFVEHDPEEIWLTTLELAREVSSDEIRAIGITNQRETCLLWDRASSRALGPAIVWQDRRSADRCETLRADGVENLVRERTGLLLDPYFSATKLEWMLENVPSARARARRGEICFGTIDSWLVYRLTEGRVHASDATNASRTMLYDIRKGKWDDDLLAVFDVPREILPEVLGSDGDFGTTRLLGHEIPICGVAGDQQAASIGQACFEPGECKSTYGTGCFALINSGERIVQSQQRLLSTIASSLGGRVSYAVEGSIFCAGASLQWLRDELSILHDSAESEALAQRANPELRVYFVPAFTGLGAPWWSAQARAAISGLTRDSGKAEIARAALEACAFQTRDLLEAMERDGIERQSSLRVDGGLARNDWAMQSIADICRVRVERPKLTETTALGAAFLAGLGAGIFDSVAEIRRLWQADRVFEPEMPEGESKERYAGWLDAVAKVSA